MRAFKTREKVNTKLDAISFYLGKRICQFFNIKVKWRIDAGPGLVSKNGHGDQGNIQLIKAGLMPEK